jgi:hypothetical protein
MRALFLNAFCFLYSTGFCQLQKLDSCHVAPTYSAFFEGLQNRDSVKVEELLKSRLLISSGKQANISTFTFTIDGDGYDIVCRKVYSNEFSVEDLRYIKSMKKGDIIWFECILSVKNGIVVSFKPFFFFIK